MSAPMTRLGRVALRTAAIGKAGDPLATRVAASIECSAPALPRIVRFLGTTDSPGANCAHCGAEGRWVSSFIVEGGQRRSAMRGCIKLYPISPVADAHQKIEKRMTDRAAKGWRPSSWDVRAMEAVEAFYSGTMPEHEAMRVVDSERRSASIYRRRRFGGRS